MIQKTLYVLDASGTYSLADTETIVTEAKRRIAAQLRRGTALSSPKAAREAIHLKLCEREHEVFGCLYIDHKHRLIEFSELFRGTICHTTVHPREVVKAALACNAAAVVFFHNHPSGDAVPSEADKAITNTLKTALSLVDIRVLDHFVIGAEDTYSFAEAGLL